MGPESELRSDEGGVENMDFCSTEGRGEAGEVERRVFMLNEVQRR